MRGRLSRASPVLGAASIAFVASLLGSAPGVAQRPRDADAASAEATAAPDRLQGDGDADASSDARAVPSGGEMTAGDVGRSDRDADAGDSAAGERESETTERGDGATTAARDTRLDAMGSRVSSETADDTPSSGRESASDERIDDGDEPPPWPEERRPPVYATWWFWTAIGAAVLGITLAVVIGLTTQDPVSASRRAGLVIRF